jgi:hypothetical protein
MIRFFFLFVLALICMVPAQTIDPPAPPDTTWWIGAPQSESDCAIKIWIGKSTTNSGAAKGSRENPYTGDHAMKEACDLARTLPGNVAILVDVPNAGDNIGFPSYYNDPYTNAGLVMRGGDNWTLIKKVGNGVAFFYGKPGTNILDMGTITPGTYHPSDNLKLILDGMRITSKHAGLGGGCMKRALVRLSNVYEVIFRNCEIYRNAPADCNLHGSLGIKITYASRLLFENNTIAANGVYTNSISNRTHINFFGTAEDIVIRNNYFHGSDYDENDKWNRITNFIYTGDRALRTEVCGNVFSCARREYDSRTGNWDSNDAPFVFYGSDMDFHHNIVIQLPQPIGAQNYRTVFKMEYSDTVERIAVRNNLFLNPNGLISYIGGFLNDFAFFNNVLVNSTKSSESTSQYVQTNYQWMPGFIRQTAYREGSQGPTGHDYNVDYAWSPTSSGYSGTPVTDNGFSTSWTPSLTVTGESNSRINDLHPGMAPIGNSTTRFNSDLVDLSIADAGPITYNAWVDHFRPVNENLAGIGTAAFYGTDYTKGSYNRDIDGIPMAVEGGRVAAGPYALNHALSVKSDVKIKHRNQIRIAESGSWIKFDLSMAGPSGSINVYTIQGRLVHSKTITAQSGSTVKMNKNQYSDGVYLYKINKGTRLFSGRFIVVK